MSQASAATTNDAGAAPDAAIGGARPRLLMKFLPALLVGAGAGWFGVAPRLFPKVAGAEAPHQAEKKAKKEGETPLFRIDNMIVNPAGSGGTRYLVVSVGFEVDDPKAEAALRGSEVQLRDAITGLLERQTLQFLTEPGARDSIRAALAKTVAPFVDGAAVHVYIPQFLIQ